MTTALRLGRVALMAAVVAGSAAAYRAATVPFAPALAPPMERRSVVRAGAATPGAVLDSLAGVAVARTPFRFSRAPSPVPYDPDRPVGAASMPMAMPPRPAPVLTGIAWGREPTGVLEGLPGTDGPRTVRPGDRLGDYRIGRITRDRVIVVGPDTTWNLSVRTTW